MNILASLPVDAIRQPLTEALDGAAQIIIHAPPGAGKSTRLPLWLLEDGRLQNHKIILIQPRRLAASNVAHFMAQQLGESLGQRIGLRTRYDTKVSSQTRIEVVTEGVFIRLIQSDPELSGVSCVIFDEFHERSLHTDLGLALSLESQEVYRDSSQPLKLIIMSATLAAEQLQALLPEAILLRSEGRSYPVETIYNPVPVSGYALGDSVAKLILQILSREQGSLLIFLPGMREIKRIARLLEEAQLTKNILICPLHSSLSDAVQRAAIEPAESGMRKIVLATNVAETSITIDGVTVVVDTGLANVASLDTQRGMSVLKTQQISKASADQRQGRAGRTAPGRCYRLWSKESHHSLYDYERPEIQRGDLTAFLLELAQWGAAGIEELRLIDLPPEKSLTAARLLLERLQLMDSRGLITSRGRQVVTLGLHPRLAAMCLEGQRLGVLSEACVMAQILTEPPLLKNNREADLSLPLEALKDFSCGRKNHSLQPASAKRLLKLATQLCRRIDKKQVFILGEQSDFNQLALLLVSAFPDRVAKRRNASSDKYLLVNSQELTLHPSDRLNGQPWLLVTDSGSSKGHGKPAYIQQAMAINDTDLAQLLEQFSTEHYIIEWRGEQLSLGAKKIQKLGAIIVSEQSVKASPESLLAAIKSYVREQGLTCLNDKPYREFAARMAWLEKQTGIGLANVTEPFLLATLEQWLEPYLHIVKKQADLKAIDIKSILINSLSWDDQQRFKQLAPDSYQLPTGQDRVIEYDRFDRPVLSARVQELYGLQQSPSINNGACPLLIELLSPGRRPLQLTDDLPGFWANTYHDVAKEMRGRYPKHYWPDDPVQAKATTKTKKWM